MGKYLDTTRRVKCWCTTVNIDLLRELCVQVNQTWTLFMSLYGAVNVRKEHVRCIIILAEPHGYVTLEHTEEVLSVINLHTYTPHIIPQKLFIQFSHNTVLNIAVMDASLLYYSGRVVHLFCQRVDLWPNGFFMSRPKCWTFVSPMSNDSKSVEYLCTTDALESLLAISPISDSQRKAPTTAFLFS